jgi:tetratricopeptide (TPR) repeat protein
MNRCLLLLLGCPIALTSAEQPADLLNQANALFRQANETSLRDPGAARELYQRAALRLERIVREEGVRNGRLFYNLGNAYFQAGEIGRAILNYRRSQLYIPDDANLAQNLSQARKARQDTFEEKQQTRVLRTLLFWHYDFSPRVRSWLLAIFSGVFWAAAAIKLRRSHWIPRAVLVVSGVVAFLFAGSVAAEVVGSGRDEGGVVLSSQVTARKGDGESYEPSFNQPLHAGTEFVLRESRNDWYYVELPDGRECWIPARSAGLVRTGR